MKKILLVAFSITLSLHAQDLKSNIEELLNTNPIILERLKNYNATKEDVTNAKSGFYPKLDLSLGIGYENTQKSQQASNLADNTTAFSVYQNSLKLTQNLFDGFKTTSQLNGQKLRTLSAAYSYIEKVNDTSLEMANAYLEVLKNSEILETAKENVIIDEDIYDKVQRLYESGLTTLSEVNKVQASLAQAKANLVVKENTLLNVSYNMQKVLGRYSNIAAMNKPNMQIVMPSSLEEAIEYALEHNPALLVSRYNIKVAQETYKEKKAPFYPQVDVEVSQSLNKNLSAIEAKNEIFHAMAYLKYNLFNGYSDTAALQKSLSQIHQEIASANTLKREMIEALSLAWASYTKLSEQIVHLKAYKEYSQKTLELYKKEYDLGRRSLLDLLSAQSDFIGAKSQIISTEYTILSSEYKILDAMGLLVSTIVGDNKQASSNVGISASTSLVLKDTLPIRLDSDNDLIPDDKDICSASLASSMKNLYGCAFVDENITSIERYDNFFFNNDINATFTEQAQLRVSALVKQLQPYGFENMKIDILSHAFDTNNSKENLTTISSARAKTLKDFFIESGVDDANISTHLLNDSAQMYVEDKDKNNRADVIVYKYYKQDSQIDTAKSIDSNITQEKEE